MKHDVLARILDCCCETKNVCKHYCFVESPAGFFGVMENMFEENWETAELSYQIIAEWAEDMKVHHMHMVKELFRQLMRGLDGLHRNGLIHRDIKPSNIMVSRKALKKDSKGVPTSWEFPPVLKIIDLTSCIGVYDPTHVREVFSPAYLSPERARCNANFHTQAADMYAAGIVLGEMSMGVSPVPNCPKDHKVMYNTLLQRPRDNGVINTIDTLLTHHALSRAKGEDVLENAWMTEEAVTKYEPRPPGTGVPQPGEAKIASTNECTHSIDSPRAGDEKVPNFPLDAPSAEVHGGPDSPSSLN
eukprot:GHVU01010679.1.p1 GENE.GHVU01010679.1~~GHVU01010679.1.p1  ORF type:complete len:302 (-),score=32.54 GHVU01010679.1:1355-2260(-)